MLIKYLVYTILILAILLLTFFGMGPVLFADGSMQERVITLLAVLLLYGALFAALAFWIRKHRKAR